MAKNVSSSTPRTRSHSSLPPEVVKKCMAECVAYLRDLRTVDKAIENIEEDIRSGDGSHELGRCLADLRDMRYLVIRAAGAKAGGKFTESEWEAAWADLRKNLEASGTTFWFLRAQLRKAAQELEPPLGKGLLGRRK